MSETLTLILGNKAYSSWSLRGWLLFRAFGLEVVERVIPLYTEEFARAQAELIAPGRQVPTLLVESDAGRQVIWDSLAIAEFLAERSPEAGHWPRDPAARAAARCLAAEMHSGFGAVRSNMPMNLKRRYPGRGRGPGVAADVARFERLVDWARMRFPSAGPFLFGAARTVPDVFFTPLATRFETYAVELSAAAQAYCDALLAAPDYLEWRAAGEAEAWVEPRYQYED